MSAATPLLELGLGSIAAIATAVSTYVTVGFKGLRTSNTELRDAINFEQGQRERERDDCARSLASERTSREADRDKATGQIRLLEGRLLSLSGEHIANAVVSAVIQTLEHTVGRDLVSRVAALEAHTTSTTKESA